MASAIDHFRMVPQPVIQQIFSYSEKAGDLVTLSEASKLFYRISGENALWEGFFNKEFPNVKPLKNKSIKQSYQQHCMLKRELFADKIKAKPWDSQSLSIPTSWASAMAHDRARLFVGGGYGGIGGQDNFIKICKKNEITGELQEEQLIQDDTGPIIDIQFAEDRLFTLSKNESNYTLQIRKESDSGFMPTQLPISISRKLFSVYCIRYQRNTLFMGTDDHIKTFKKNAQGAFQEGVSLKGRANCLAFKDHLLFAGNKECIEIWKRQEDGSFIKRDSFKANSAHIHCFCTKGDTLFSSFWDQTIKIWNADSKGAYREAQQLEGHKRTVNSLTYHDGLLFSSDDKTLCVWENTGNVFKQIATTSLKSDILCHAFFNDLFVVGTEEGVKAFDFYKPKKSTD